MGFPPIPKARREGSVAPNLDDYDRVRAEFRWDTAARELEGQPGGGLNIAHEAVTRHATSARATQVAIRWIGKDDTRVELTYADLERETSRFANLLGALGVGRGERVFGLCPRIPELYVAALGTLRTRAVFSPLFSAFGPEPIAQRLKLGEARVLVTTERLYRRKVAEIRASIPTLEHVIVVGDARDPSGAATETDVAGTRDWRAEIGKSSDRHIIPETDPETPALLHFTSGTTGTPKGALHVHRAVVAHHVTGALALDLHPGDLYWCTADPGWVTGTSYGIVAPLTNGVTMLVDEAELDVPRWYRLLAEEKVQVWYTAPTAIRMLMRAGLDPLRGHDLSALRFLASVGEPLNPEAVVWGREAFGIPFHDNWWQTETGGIMVANYASMDVRPGSMGKPLPGIDAAIVETCADGSVAVVEAEDVEGQLAIQSGWPSMFRAYVNAEERYRKCFARDAEGREWYLSGDLARRDADGYFWFIGRADDVIKSAGHLIGPFEVESVLVEHPAVVEAAVIGKPDEVAGNLIKAFVVLHHGHEATPALVKELLGFARAKLGPAAAPREIDVVLGLPKTRSGKIMRRLLRARELGLPEGDTSTLEEDVGGIKKEQDA